MTQQAPRAQGLAALIERELAGTLRRLQLAAAGAPDPEAAMRQALGGVARHIASLARIDRAAQRRRAGP